mgnify:FL=1|jgi:hypothetical protein
MGGNTSTSSSSGGGGGGSNNNNNNQANQISKQVKKDIGLTAVGGIGGPQMGYVASNAPNPQMYGKAASESAKKRMAEAGMGTYNPETGSFQNVVNNQIISGTGSVMGASMGSGESTIMGQIPISKQMFESQKRLQMIATGAMATLGVPLMGAAFMDYNKKRYSDYVTSFNTALQSSTSYAAASPSTRDTSDATIQDTKAQAESGEAAAVQQALNRKAAIARKEAAVKGSRTFFGGRKRTIEGRMVGGL